MAHKDPARAREYSRLYRLAHHDQVLAANRLWHEAHLAERREYRRLHPTDNLRRSRHGLTAAGIDALYASQAGLCGICGTPVERHGKAGVHVDHDHQSGDPRGLLCRNCNVALPAVERYGGSWIIRALAYLGDPPASHLTETGRPAAVGSGATVGTDAPLRVVPRRKDTAS